MTITAKYASRCATCGHAVSPGQSIEWDKNSPVRHTACGGTSGGTSAAPAARTTRYSRGSSSLSDTVRCRHCGKRTAEGDDWCQVCGRADYE